MDLGRSAIRTAKCQTIAGDDASLDDGVLLAGEGRYPEAEAGEEAGPRLDEEETEQTSGNIQRRDDPDGEVELVGDDAKEAA